MEAVGVAGAAAGVGIGLFGYNRGNYNFDQKMHFSRFTSGYTFANAATKMYRDDIADFTSLTSTKLTQFVDNACIGFHIFTAMACPGRLGLHTVPPPSWLSALFHTNLGAGYIFLALTFWFGVHAVCRSDVAATHLLTRWIRFPIPSTKMLDRARAFLSDYEGESKYEMLRVPFLKRHPGDKRDGRFNEDPKLTIEKEAQDRTRHGLDVPSWYKREKQVDTGYTFESMMPYAARGTAPEHFEVYREVQNEWWPYDVYCRISMSLAHLHMFHAWSYFQIGHNFVETRALWPAGCVVACCWVVQMVILTLDIIPKKNELPVHWLGPLGPPLAFLACACGEYNRFYSPGGLYFSFILVFFIYGFHIAYVIWLIRLCRPDMDKPPEAAEVPNRSWWPASWRLPEAWLHSVWVVPPPRNLLEGQTDLPGEMREVSQSLNGGAADEFYQGGLDDMRQKKKDVHMALGKQGESPAWRSVQFALSAIVVAWAWCTLGYVVDVATQGTSHPSILSAPGLPNHMRDPRYRPAKPGFDRPQEVGVGEEEEEEGGEEEHRRLSTAPEFTAREMAAKLRDVIRNLEQLVEPAHAEGSAATAIADLPVQSQNSEAPRRAALRWPALFEPQLLACGPSGDLAALSVRGRGLVVSTVNETLNSAWELPVESSQFLLEGVTKLGALAASSWDDFGLILATSSGKLVECPGAEPGAGRWRCQSVDGAALPIGHAPGARVLAIARNAEDATALRAAVHFPGEGTLTILSRREAAAPWLPMGEVRVPGPAVSATFAQDSLLMVTKDGSVVDMSLTTGAASVVAESVGSASMHTWQAVCSRPDASRPLARLGIRPIGAALTEPTLLLGA
mmetsp:Transcript_68341/g.163969  ORF Transcript_68341/g.163969 Transcript_68341/m.163969 type:complete len:848 (-) Transcript_68341:92-2635(-)|eukprot:CAMPEP_0178420246 /NCGR_PEP_ID=MMETSP0689_2-20121128/26029_1 /TAXON_ID=160604 /ORGANISM="Amphidinium massartii, Strain CS-259" /LENGTH=847 /DNA_ID=CAMNT_0020041713 /DNA_START=98 /DNA_END=2641 /DNA_ORIENTATION=-